MTLHLPFADGDAPRWTTPPADWRVDGDALTVTARARTDFWRHTHYGFVRDDGHAWLAEHEGDLELVARVRGAWRDQYDQAGLMLRVDETTWIKCGVEYVDGVQQASAVVTRGHSDWAVAPLADAPPATWFRLTRRDDAVHVHVSADGARWRLLRLAWFPAPGRVAVGPMCASPDGAGCTVVFDHLALRTPAEPTVLHGG